MFFTYLVNVVYMLIFYVVRLRYCLYLSCDVLLWFSM
jgi:hypothetical protein